MVCNLSEDTNLAVILMPKEYSPDPVWDDRKATGDSIDLVAIASALLSKWPFILAMCLGGFVFALGISLLLTPKFTAKASFLPPVQRTSPDNPFAGLLKTPSTNVYTGLLLSETVIRDVVEHANLQRVFNAKDDYGARTELRNITRVSTDTSGLVMLAVTHKDPKVAQEIAADFLTALGRLNDGMAISDAARERLVYESALRREKDNLENTEIELKKMQESSGVVLPQSQTLAGLSAIDSVRAQIRTLQVRLTAIQQSQTDQAPEVIRTRSQLGALESQLRRLESGSGGAAGESLTATKAPGVNLGFVRLERELKYHQVLFDVMAKQYENARLQESSAAPGVQVVDFPEVPLRKSWPQRSVFSLAGGFLGGFVALILVFGKNRREAMLNDPDSAASLARLAAAYRSASVKL